MTASGTTHDARLLFGARGLRLTRQRQALYDALRQCRCHPTAEELHRLVSPTCSMSLATVYNTLQVLRDAGLCRRLATTDGSCRYDAGPDEHAHLCMEGRDDLVDLPPTLSRRLLEQIDPALLSEIGEAMGVDVDGVMVILKGRCGQSEAHPRPPADRC